TKTYFELHNKLKIFEQPELNAALPLATQDLDKMRTSVAETSVKDYEEKLAKAEAERAAAWQAATPQERVGLYARRLIEIRKTDDSIKKKRHKNDDERRDQVVAFLNDEIKIAADQGRVATAAGILAIRQTLIEKPFNAQRI